MNDDYNRSFHKNSVKDTSAGALPNVPVGYGILIREATQYLLLFV